MERIDYPYDTSTVFNAPSSTENATDEKMGDLLVVDYRYARFALDPRTGLFNMIRQVLLQLQDTGNLLLCGSCWRDSSWNGLAAIQSGLTPIVRTQRRELFGQNSLDIQGKSTVSLLIDEVCDHRCIYPVGTLNQRVTSDHPSFLHLPNCEHSSVVIGRLLLLRVLHRFDFCDQHRNNFGRYQEGGVHDLFAENRQAEGCSPDDLKDEGDVSIFLSSERTHRRRM